MTKMKTKDGQRLELLFMGFSLSFGLGRLFNIVFLNGREPREICLFFVMVIGVKNQMDMLGK